MILGQIHRGTVLGNEIYNLVKQDNIKIIVEIGTWNGLGTTKCIRDAIIDSNKQEYLVISIEANKERFEEAIKNNYPPLNNFKIVYGSITSENDFLNFNDIDEKYFSMYSRRVQSEWYNEDLNNCKNSPNVFNIIPKKIDLLILDGGEFSTLGEYQKLKDRYTYLAMDDTKCIKTSKIREKILNDKDHIIINDDTNAINGCMVCKKANKINDVSEEILKYIPYNCGIYIECGANDGIFQSNTYKLELNGWRGLLIEPSPNVFNMCKINRSPENIFVCAALVSNKFEGDVVVGDFNGNPMASINGKRLKNKYSSNVQVKARTLNSILEQYNFVNKIDFFSLDVEGYELEVLNGINFKKYFFKYILIEVNKCEEDELFPFMINQNYNCIGCLSNFNKKDDPNWTEDHNDYLFKCNNY